jgi:predicted Zn-dependent peptidase
MLGLARGVVSKESCIALKATRLASSSSPSVSTAAQATGVYSLSNGLRVAAEDTGSELSTIALHVEAGTRHEKVNGVSNFISRLATKGSSQWTQQQLETQVGKLGANLKVQVNKEYTSFILEGFSKDAAQAVNILSDLVNNAVYDENKINAERQRIREKLSSNTDYESIVMDYLYSVAYQGTPLANSLCGTGANIEKISRTDILSFIDNNYKAPRMLLTSVGGVKQDVLVQAAEKNLSGVSTKYPGDVELAEPCRFTASEVQHRDDAMEVAHVVTALESCGMSDPAYVPLQILSTLLGSADKSRGASSRTTYQWVRDFPGFYAMKNFNHQFSDQGLFGTYMAATPEALDDTTTLVPRLWARLCTSLVDSQVEMGKRELRTQLASIYGNPAARTDLLARQILFQGKSTGLGEYSDAISEWSSKGLADTAYDYIYDQGFARSAYGPTEAVSDYNMTQSHLYWVRW